MKVLILGGTSEARLLAKALASRGTYQTTLSLAGILGAEAEGRFRSRLTAGENASLAVRTGGFGGADGLSNHLLEQQIGLLVDATHPDAARISTHAVTASQTSKTPLLRLLRPPWTSRLSHPWLEAKDSDQAVQMLPPGSRVFLAVGRHSMAPFLARTDCFFLARSLISFKQAHQLTNIVLLREPPGDNLDVEMDLLMRYEIDCLVSKNSGSDLAHFKVEAAQTLGLRIVMIDRPSLPPCDEVQSVADALKWIDRCQPK